LRYVERLSFIDMRVEAPVHLSLTVARSAHQLHFSNSVSSTARVPLSRSEMFATLTPAHMVEVHRVRGERAATVRARLGLEAVNVELVSDAAHKESLYAVN